MTDTTAMSSENKMLELSHSSMQLYHSCARKLEFRKFYEYSKWEESVPASVGQALHRGYQQYLINPDDKEAAIWEMMKAYPLKWQKTENDLRSMQASYMTLLAMMAYPAMEDYELAYLNINGEMKPAIEVPFRIRFRNVEIPGYDLSYIGYTDAILYKKSADQYTVFDIKTHRDTSYDLTPKYLFDTQCIPYAIVLEHILGKKINTLTVNYFTAFVDIMQPDIQIFQFEKTKQDVQDWLQGLYLDILAIKQYKELNFFPRDARSCVLWGRPCPNLEFCHSRDPALINHMLALAAAAATDAAPKHKIKPWIDFEIEIGV